MEKLFMEQFEMVTLFVKQRMHEFILFDGNSMLCVSYEISIMFNDLQRTHIKEMTELGMSVFPKEWYQSSNINVWMILDKHIHNRLMVVVIKEDSSSQRLESRRILHAIVMGWNQKGYS
jgi:hypothetical protein